MPISHSPSSEPTGAVARAARVLISMAVIGLSVGVVMGFVSYGFVVGVQELSGWRHNTAFAVLHLGDVSLAFGPMLILLVAAMLVLALRRFVPTPFWHGPPDSIHAAHLPGQTLDIRAGLASTLAAFLSAGGGASVGQYGPLVHFGATIGCVLRRRLGSAITVDVFIGCGVAAAIAAGFNAPIAGVIFAHETILRHFSFRAITPIVISSITAAWVRTHILHGDPLFVIAAGAVDLTSLLPIALLAGPLFGVLAVIYMRSLRYSADLAVRTGWSQGRRIFTAAILTGIIAMFVPEVLGLGTSAMQAMLDGGFNSIDLALLVLLKLAVTAICLGFGFAGGMFLPAMFIGLGSGTVLSRIIVGAGMLPAGVGLAICGMAAIGAAVIGAPITAVLIVLEVTGSYELALAAMVSIVTAIAMSHLLFGASYFDRLLLDRGIDMTRGRSHVQMMHARIDHCVSQEFVNISPQATIGEVRDALRQANATEAYVIDGPGHLVGKLTLFAIMDAVHSEAALPYATMAIISISHAASLQQAIEQASKFVGETIPVIDHETGVMSGVVTEAALFQQYLALQNRIRTLEHT